MKIGWRIKANVVTFVVLAIGLSYAMATQVLSVLEDRYSVYALFPDAGGVFTNQEVTYRGITVGQVGRMEVVEDGVSIELLIKEKTKIPAEDVIARVMFKSAVGEQFVDILPQTEGEPYLQDGDQIPMDQTEIPVSTQELLSTLEAVLRGVPPEALEGAVDALGEGLRGRGRDLATILESSADLAELFARRAPETTGILRKGTTVGGAFLRSKEDFAAAIKHLVTVSESLANSTGHLERLMIGANLASDEIIALIRQNRAALHEFLQEFAEVNDLQAEHARDLSLIFRHLPTALARVNLAFESGTGLIRFGLVDDHKEPEACSYNTPRRSPTDRKPQLPPKNARCGSLASEGTSSSSTSSTSSTSAASASPAARRSAIPEEPALPARMSDWSWTLFYLHGTNPSS